MLLGMGSVTVKHAITYHAPPEAVFAAITDVDQEPQWQPQVKRVWHEPGGPVAVGTKIGRERKIMGKVTVQLSEVVALVPGASFEMREQDDGDQSPFRVSYQLTPVGTDSTRLEFALVIGGVPTVFTSAVRRRLGGELADQFDRLGELLTRASVQGN
jgi:uncharacterized protein YndB with AHSA1/START domain